MFRLSSRRCLLLLLAWLTLLNVSQADDLWLAVGYGGRRMISTDGHNWKVTAEWAQPGGDDGHNLMSAVYAQDKFVVVGGGGGGPSGAGHILVSSDGVEWKETYKDKARINPVVYGNGRFIVGTSSYPAGKLMWSSDAQKWETGGAIQTKGLTHFRHGAFGNGVFLLVGNGRIKNAEGQDQEVHWAITTRDGETMLSERTDLMAHGRIEFGAGRFVMLSHDGVLLSSADGRKWDQPKLAGTSKPSWLIWDAHGKRFLLGNYQTGWESKDGITWTAGGMKASTDIRWTDGQRFIGVGWPGKHMWFSPDGKSWEKSPELPPNGINVVVGRNHHATTPE